MSDYLGMESYRRAMGLEGGSLKTQTNGGRIARLFAAARANQTDQAEAAIAADEEFMKAMNEMNAQQYADALKDVQARRAAITERIQELQDWERTTNASREQFNAEGSTARGKFYAEQKNLNSRHNSSAMNWRPAQQNVYVDVNTEADKSIPNFGGVDVDKQKAANAFGTSDSALSAVSAELNEARKVSEDGEGGVASITYVGKDGKPVSLAEFIDSSDVARSSGMDQATMSRILRTEASALEQIVLRKIAAGEIKNFPTERFLSASRGEQERMVTGLTVRMMKEKMSEPDGNLTQIYYGRPKVEEPEARGQQARPDPVLVGDPAGYKFNGLDPVSQQKEIDALLRERASIEDPTSPEMMHIDDRIQAVRDLRQRKFGRIFDPRDRTPASDQGSIFDEIDAQAQRLSAATGRSLQETRQFLIDERLGRNEMQAPGGAPQPPVAAEALSPTAPTPAVAAPVPGPAAPASAPPMDPGALRLPGMSPMPPPMQTEMPQVLPPQVPNTMESYRAGAMGPPPVSPVGPMGLPQAPGTSAVDRFGQPTGGPHPPFSADAAMLGETAVDANGNPPWNSDHALLGETRLEHMSEWTNPTFDPLDGSYIQAPPPEPKKPQARATPSQIDSKLKTQAVVNGVKLASQQLKLARLLANTTEGRMVERVWRQSLDEDGKPRGKAREMQQVLIEALDGKGQQRALELLVARATSYDLQQKAGGGTDA